MDVSSPRVSRTVLLLGSLAVATLLAGTAEATSGSGLIDKAAKALPT